MLTSCLGSGTDDLVHLRLCGVHALLYTLLEGGQVEASNNLVLGARARHSTLGCTDGLLTSTDNRQQISDCVDVCLKSAHFVTLLNDPHIQTTALCRFNFSSFKVKWS